MKILFLLVVILDGMVVGGILALLCQAIFGNKPLARLLKLLTSILGGGAYSLWVLYTGLLDESISMLAGAIIWFAPIVLLIILAILAYMFKDEIE